MSENYSTVLTRGLRVGSEHRGNENLDVTLEIGVPRNAQGGELVEGCAGFRISPLTDWTTIYGVDAIQAVFLAIQLAEEEAAKMGAVWPDEALDA